MFEHSIKVPRHYKIAANIFKKVSTEGGSVKTLLYDDKLRHFRTNVLYALITETIKHAADIDKIFENCSIFKSEPRLDPWLAKVLTAELLFGKKTLPGKSKPEQTILSYKTQFESYTADHQDVLKTEVIRRPRYVRINTNLLTTSDAISFFQDEGYRFIRCTSGSYNDYLSQIQGLTEDDFTQDYHVKTVFVFSPGTKLHEHELYLENKIILQDKATAMAVHLLAPPSGSTVLDMCAAPGMKTTQLAAYMKNEGKIYAVERNEKRYQTLCDFVEKTGSKCVEPIHKDALEIKRGDYDDVEYILLDPSCSGSGMELCVHNYIEASRLAKLTSLQEKFLKHAMNAFPKVKRIVYSTCSIFPEENERVVTNVVKTSRTKWRVQDVKELLKNQWNNFGSGMYGSMGVRCLYAKADTDFTTGFFMAVIDRDQKDLEKIRHINSIEENPKKKSKTKRDDENVNNVIENINKTNKESKYESKEAQESREDAEENTEIVKKKKKKKDKRKNLEENEVNENISKSEDQPNVEVTKTKKKNRNEEIFESDDTHNSSVGAESVVCVERKKKRKREVNVDNEVHLAENSIDELQADAGGLLKKKKKKSKTTTEYLNTSQVESDIVNNDIIRKKKKKKRDKESADTET